jgi:glycogen debranching enzyme
MVICQALSPGGLMSALDQPWLHELVTALSAPTVVLSESSGQIRSQGAQGALHADIRVLSEAVLTVGGAEPTPASGGVVGARTARFTGVARALGDEATVDPTVRVERERTVAAGEVSERIRLVSFSDSPIVTELSLSVAADLASLAQIKSARSAAPVRVHPGISALTWENGSITVALAAPDAAVSVSGAGTSAALRWPVKLDGRGFREVSWRLSVTDTSAAVAPAPPSAGAGAGAGVVGAHTGKRPPGRASADADDPRLPALLDQSLADADALRMTVPRAPEDVFLAAGAPWYFTLFGRDSIWAARLLLPFGWQLAAGTLRALAAFQGTQVNPATAEAPGKIPHELRRGGYVYYGTIDATPLWICLLHDAWRWGMPDDQVRALLPNLQAALDCMARYGDSDGDGLLEYIDASGHGLSNQGWKDSGDSIRFSDGRVASPPVALCEVQGYAHEAAVHGADLLDFFGVPGGKRWREWAARLATVFRESFWVKGYPALALDAAKHRVDSLTSNIGHLLGTGLLTVDEEALVAGRLGGDDMNSGYGLRTMSSRDGGYNPLSYHCGSVWTHDTAIVVHGLFRSGHSKTASSLADGLLAAAAAFNWRLPELFSGDAGSWPTPYPAACRPQAWSAAAAGALVQGLLGLDVDVPSGTIAMRPPGVRIGRAGLRLHVDGLVAGIGTFNAGITGSGRPYLRGCALRQVPLGPRRHLSRRRHSADFSHSSTPAMWTVAHDLATSGSRAASASRIARCSVSVRWMVPVWVMPRHTRARVVGPDMDSSSEDNTEFPAQATIVRWNSRSFRTRSSGCGSGPRLSSSSRNSPTCDSLIRSAAIAVAAGSRMRRTCRNSSTVSSWWKSVMKLSASSSRRGSRLVT